MRSTIWCRRKETLREHKAKMGKNEGVNTGGMWHAAERPRKVSTGSDDMETIGYLDKNSFSGVGIRGTKWCVENYF